MQAVASLGVYSVQLVSTSGCFERLSKLHV